MGRYGIADDQVIGGNAANVSDSQSVGDEMAGGGSKWAGFVDC